MKKLLFSIAVVMLVVVFAGTAYGAQGTLVRSTPQYDKYSFTFGANVVDTIKWARPAGVSGIAVGVYVADTLDMSATSAVYRVINGIPVTALTADTLANLEALAATDYLVPKTSLDAVTLAPLAEEYWFVWTMHSSACGTGTTNTAYFYVFKSYAK